MTASLQLSEVRTTRHGWTISAAHTAGYFEKCAATARAYAATPGRSVSPDSHARFNLNLARLYDEAAADARAAGF